MFAGSPPPSAPPLPYPPVQGLASVQDARGDAQAELRVVLKQGVGPGGPLAIGVGGVRVGGCGATPDRGAARGIGDDEALPEQLGEQLHVARFAAALACPAELHTGIWQSEGPR